MTVKTETGEHLVPRKVADHLHVSVGSLAAATFSDCGQAPDSVRRVGIVRRDAHLEQREAEPLRDRLRRVFSGRITL